MSKGSLRKEAARWLRQGGEDLQTAEILVRESRFPQACFLAQQAAEKAVKAVLIAADRDPWGHSISRLVADGDLPELVPFLDDALDLDKFYIPTRYPNGLPELIPQEAYRERDGRQALDAAARLLAACRAILNIQ